VEKLLRKLTAPTLLVDLNRVRNNISRMKAKADASQALLQPHFKTHQSLGIAAEYINQGVHAATVSSLQMAQYFADGGWKRIHLALPIIPGQENITRAIAQKCALTCNVSRPEHVTTLTDTSIEGVYIDIDNGYGRTGIRVDNIRAICALLSAIDKAGLTFKGFYYHNGNSYGMDSPKTIVKNHEAALGRMRYLQNGLGRSSTLMLGDTPSCSLVSDFNEVDIVSAGNYIFYDLMQYNLGSCQLEDIAVCMACPVIEKNDYRQTVVVHGGAVHFSKEMITKGGNSSFGRAVELNYDEWKTNDIGSLISISQEHGTISLDEKSFKQVKIGDFIGILPVHSCLTADAMGTYLSTSGVSISMM